MNFSSCNPQRAVLLGMILFLACSVAQAAETEKRAKHSHSAAGLSGLTLTNGVGMIEVRGETRDDIAVEILYQVRAKKIEEAESVIERFTLGMREDGDWLVIMPLFDGEDFGGRKPRGLGKVNLRIDILAKVPRDLRVTATVTSDLLRALDLTGGATLGATSGDINLERIEGDLVTTQTSGDLSLDTFDGILRANSTSGNMTLRDLRAEVTLVAISGEIDAKGVEGTLEINNKGGDILLQDIDGPATIVSSFGSVEVIEARDLLQVNTSSGEIFVVGVGYAGQAISLASSSGNIEVEVRPEAALNIGLNTSTGSIRARLPLEIDDVSRTRLLAKMNNGKDLLEIVTASGDIRIHIMED